MKEVIRKTKKVLRRVFKKQNVMKVLILVSGAAMIVATILPYILR